MCLNPLSCMKKQLTIIIGLLLSSSITVHAQVAQKLRELGMENIRTIETGGTTVAAFEDNVYRGTYRGVGKAIIAGMEGMGNGNLELVALDGNGKELVVLGRGVGFPKMPYELTDLSRIERTFYDVNPKYFGMAADLPRPLVLACAEITERAEIELDCALNPNLPFTLADHLNFAAERLRKGIEISTPLAYDVRHLYPKETELAKQARELLAREAGLTARL